jgi:hypothetical protein
VTVFRRDCDGIEHGHQQRHDDDLGRVVRHHRRDDFTNNGTLTISGSGTLDFGQDFLGSGTSSMTGGTLKVGREFRLAAAGVTNWSATGGTIEFTTVANGDAGQFTGSASAASNSHNVVVSGTNGPWL